MTWTRDADVSVIAGPATTTTISGGAETVVRRSTSLGELVVTLGPAMEPVVQSIMRKVGGPA